MGTIPPNFYRYNSLSHSRFGNDLDVVKEMVKYNKLSKAVKTPFIGSQKKLSEIKKKEFDDKEIFEKMRRTEMEKLKKFLPQDKNFSEEYFMDLIKKNNNSAINVLTAIKEGKYPELAQKDKNSLQQQQYQKYLQQYLQQQYLQQYLQPQQQQQQQQPYDYYNDHYNDGMLTDNYYRKLGNNNYNNKGGWRNWSNSQIRNNNINPLANPMLPFLLNQQNSKKKEKSEKLLKEIQNYMEIIKSMKKDLNIPSNNAAPPKMYKGDEDIKKYIKEYKKLTKIYESSTKKLSKGIEKLNKILYPQPRVSNTRSHNKAARGRSHNKAARGRSYNKAARGRSHNKAARGRSYNKAARGISHNKAARGIPHNRRRLDVINTIPVMKWELDDDTLMLMKNKRMKNKANIKNKRIKSKAKIKNKKKRFSIKKLFSRRKGSNKPVKFKRLPVSDPELEHIMGGSKYYY